MRRSLMRLSALALSALAVLVTRATPAGAAQTPAKPMPTETGSSPSLGVDPAELSSIVTHPLLMYSTLKRAVYVGKERDADTGRSSKIRVEMTVRDTADAIAGAQATVLDIAEYTDDQLAGETHDYLAQHTSGAVYYLAERIDDYDNGKVIGHEGQWMGGDNGTAAGLFMPATCKVGDVFEPRRAAGVSHERSKVVAVARTVKVPAGTFKDCIEIEVYDVVDKETRRQWYCPKTGLVKESSADRTVELAARESR